MTMTRKNPTKYVGKSVEMLKITDKGSTRHSLLQKQLLTNLDIRQTNEKDE